MLLLHISGHGNLNLLAFVTSASALAYGRDVAVRDEALHEANATALHVIMPLRCAATGMPHSQASDSGHDAHAVGSGGVEQTKFESQLNAM